MFETAPAAAMRLRWFAVLGVGCLALTVMAVAYAPLLAIALVLGLLVFGVAFAVHRRFSVTMLWPLGLVAFVQPMNGLRPVLNASYGDVALACTALFALFTLRVATLRPRLIVPLVGTFLVLAGGMLGTLASVGRNNPLIQTLPDIYANRVGNSLFGLGDVVSPTLKFLIGAPMVIVIFIMLDPHPQLAILLTRMYAAGAAVSAVFALAGYKTGFDVINQRASGLGYHWLHFALSGVFGFAVAVGWVVSATDWRSRCAASIIGALCLTAVVLSGARSAAIACGIIGIYFALLGRARGLAWFVGLCSALFGLLWTVHPFLPAGNVVNRIFNFGSVAGTSLTLSNADHENAMRDAIVQIGDYPFTGSGFVSGLSAHNLFLQTATIGGPLAIVGLIVALGTVATIGLYHLVRGVPTLQWPRIAPIAGVIGYMALAQFENILWDRHLWFFICCALLCVPTLSKSGDSSEERPGGPESKYLSSGQQPDVSVESDEKDAVVA
ncbi:MAG: O-antigen ligase family protein [Nocardiaceae bacterium]|nr:O-antigen ligase family protein [Nocardiaceae bacterium]